MVKKTFVDEVEESVDGIQELASDVNDANDDLSKQEPCQQENC